MRDKVGHDHLEKFLRHRIADERLVRMMLKWLKAGVIEDGQWFETKEGTPGHPLGRAVISPLLANLYLHHVLGLWAQAWRKKVAHGDVIVVRYADDAVLGFQYRDEAEKFLPRNQRGPRYGRYAAERRGKRGEGKPETFNFLGFTDICGKNHKTEYFQVYRKTIGKRVAAKLKEIRQKLRERLHEKTRDIGKWLGSVVRGYCLYHAVPRNEDRLKAFRHEVLRMWWWQLRRRSQRSRWSWERFREKLGHSIPEVEIQHPYPEVRFASKHPKVRTVCVRSARTDLCEGWPVTAIPTATQPHARLLHKRVN